MLSGSRVIFPDKTNTLHCFYRIYFTIHNVSSVYHIISPKSRPERPFSTAFFLEFKFVIFKPSTGSIDLSILAKIQRFYEKSDRIK